MRSISSSIGSSSTMQAAEASTLPPSPTAAMTQRSPWHSPVPYLFGGLAAMLGLIAFALLILACSYWRLSGQMDERDRHGGDDDRDERDLESGAGEKDSGKGVVKVYEEKILVIMAGDDKPTFLATPACTKVCSFGAKTEKRKGESNEEENENSEKVKEVMMMMISDPHDHDHDGANNSEEARDNQLEARDDQNQ
ncbi:hypothetical protein PanWU01x14_060060 [Parasponia andersonii]|uniref:Protein GLUTAMINE DUMPER n=1 Tax=Parasponia andersonii TaxID=3476 RepID=A0A2P5DIT9_PARAD|nr:hypothetical protein PanWU01x14_060060 [Parasponia andersonii]